MNGFGYSTGDNGLVRRWGRSAEDGFYGHPFSISELHRMRKAQATDSRLKVEAGIESAVVEREFKLMNLGDDGAELMQRYLEKEHNFVTTKDRTISDEYFELEGGEGAVKELGDWPRIRTEEGKRLNSETGEYEDFFSVEFIVKGKIQDDDGHETRSERGNARYDVVGTVVRFAAKGEDGSVLTKEETFETPEKAREVARSYVKDAMRTFVKTTLRADPDRLALWGVRTKRRVTQEQLFTDSKGEVHKIAADYDRQETRSVIFFEDEEVSDADRRAILEAYKKNGIDPPKKLLHDGTVVFKKGEQLDIPLGHIPVYAEVEVTYPPFREYDSPTEKEWKQATIQEIQEHQQDIEDNLKRDVFDQLNEERPDDQKIERAVGGLAVVFSRYEIPDVGVRKGAR